MLLTGQPAELYWDATYAIAMALRDHYPTYNPENVGLEELAGMAAALPGFQDDLALVTDRILVDIQTVWYEEAINL
jgi:FeS assembly protein IscX